MMIIPKLKLHQCKRRYYFSGRTRRSSAGFDLFSKIASATGGQIVHTSSSSLGGLLGSFVKVNIMYSNFTFPSFSSIE